MTNWEGCGQLKRQETLLNIIYSKKALKMLDTFFWRIKNVMRGGKPQGSIHQMSKGASNQPKDCDALIEKALGWINFTIFGIYQKRHRCD